MDKIYSQQKQAAAAFIIDGMSLSEVAAAPQIVITPQQITRGIHRVMAAALPERYRGLFEIRPGVPILSGRPSGVDLRAMCAEAAKVLTDVAGWQNCDERFSDEVSKAQAEAASGSVVAAYNRLVLSGFEFAEALEKVESSVTDRRSDAVSELRNLVFPPRPKRPRPHKSKPINDAYAAQCVRYLRTYGYTVDPPPKK